MAKTNLNYTIGLDIGTNTVGWAVMDENFKLVQAKKRINDNGKIRKSKTNLWGVRLFEEGHPAADRRLKRGQRRRIARRKERLNYLRGIFEEEIMKVDDSFFIRLDESFYLPEDKQSNSFVYRDKNGEKKQKNISNKEVVKYPLFKTEEDEKAYYQDFPTIYHLRKALFDCTFIRKEDGSLKFGFDKSGNADIRLVYLGIHHILKYRGHFTNQGQKFDLKNINIAESLAETLAKFEVISDFSFGVSDKEKSSANAILTNKNWSRLKKAYELNQYYSIDAESVYRRENEKFTEEYENLTDKQKEKFIESKQKQLKALFTAIVGNSIDLKVIFSNEEYKSSSENGIPKGGDFKYGNENFDEKLAELDGKIAPEEIEVIANGKKVYEAIILSKILIKEDLSSSMIEKYKQHQTQLKKLKRIARAISDNFYNKIFKNDGIYEYFVKGKGNPAKVIGRDEFYKAIKTVFETEFKGLKFPDGDKEFDFSKVEMSLELQKYLLEISNLMKFDNFLPKQRMSDNGAIPYQVHEYELKAIIERQNNVFPFLAEEVDVEIEDENGEITYKKEYKIISLFKFRIPYYVGTLAQTAGWTRVDNILQRTESPAKNSWLVRKNNTKLTPWNFSQIINKEESAGNFIERMTNFDTYLPEEKVLPNNSLLYQEFKIFNELIICGYYQTIQGKRQKNYFDAKMRQVIFNDLFKNNKKVTAKKLIEYLRNVHHIVVSDQKDLFGIDTFIKSASFNTSYSTYIDLINAGINENVIENNKDKFEQIIKWQTIFEDRKVLKNTIKKANDSWQILTLEQVNKISRKHYTGWGRLSKKLLTNIVAANGKTIIENLKEEPYRNFIRLLEDEKIAESIKNAQTKNGDGLSYNLVADLAGSPAIKKGIWQSLKIILELEDYLGRENIAKIVIEMSREDGDGRNKTRQKQIENFYKTFKEKTGDELQNELKKDFEKQDVKAFDNEKLFLYFMQNGKCMYSLEDLDLADLSSYEVDHIIPQTFIKDDSFNNKVLVKKKANQDKGGDTPTVDIIGRMRGFWTLLLKSGQITKQKFANLTTKSGTISNMNSEQLKGFINRQLVENRQITKHVANILSSYFSGSAEILTPKSALTSQFRQGVVYVPKAEFDFKNNENYEFDGNYFGINGEILAESKYLDKKFVKWHYHSGFTKNRELNSYHHAHDAFLNAVVADYIYRAFPQYKKMWVYGSYQRKTEKEVGKYGGQRQSFAKQLLSGMVDENWKLVNPDTGVIKEYSQSEIMARIKKTLNFRNVNIVKKTELQLGKFGDESIYRKDDKAKNFSSGLKNSRNPNKYGGAKKPTSAFTIVAKNKKNEIKPLSISAMWADKYLKSANKLEFARSLYPNEKITDILVEKIPKYTKYVLPNGAIRLLASHQEAQSGVDLPMMKIANEKSSDETLLQNFDELAVFIKKNRLFTEKKIKTLSEIRESFMNSSITDRCSIINEMLRVAKGSNQGLKALQKAGLGTTAQQLQSDNTVTNDTTIVYQSITGLYEKRIKLE